MLHTFPNHFNKLEAHGFENEKTFSRLNPADINWHIEAGVCAGALHIAIDKANLVIAVVAHSGATGRERARRAEQQRLATGAIGRRAPPEETHSGRNYNNLSLPWRDRE